MDPVGPPSSLAASRSQNVCVDLWPVQHQEEYTVWVNKSPPQRFSDIFSQTVGNF